jgi:hypothetical protein
MKTEPVTIRLGDEFDERLRDAIRSVLAELDAELTDTSWSVGGSQEIETLVAVVGGECIVVEAETTSGSRCRVPGTL